MSRSTLAALFTLVTLLVSSSDVRAQTQYWDGATTTGTAGTGIAGGSGTWDGTFSGPNNWTTSTGTPNSQWGDGAGNGNVAVFTIARPTGTSTAMGTFTVATNSPLYTATQLSFLTGGYSITPDSSGAGGILSLSGSSIINTAQGATILNIQLTSTTTISKTGAGQLVLTVDNTNSNGAGAAGIAGVTLNAGSIMVTNKQALGTGLLTLSTTVGFQNYLQLSGTLGSFGGNVSVTGTGIALIITDQNGTTANSFGTLALNNNGIYNENNQLATSNLGALTFGATTLSGTTASITSATLNGTNLVTLASVTGTSTNFIVGGSGSTTVAGTTNLGSGNLIKYNAGALTLNGSVSTTGSINLIQETAGSVTLGGTGTSSAVFAGAQNILVNGGSLSLGTTASTSGIDRISDTATLTLAGGNLIASGLTGTATSETIGALNLGVGASRITAGAASTGTQTITFASSITRVTGGAITFGATGALGNGFVQFTASQLSNVNASGMIGGWATSGDDFATISNSGTQVLNMSGPGTSSGTYTTFNNSDFSTSATTTTNVKEIILANTAGVTLSQSSTIGSLNLSGTVTSGLDILNLGGKKLTIASGGILGRATTPNLAIVNGTLTANGNGTSAAELFLTANNAVKYNVGATITNNGSGAVSLVENGTAANTYFLSGANTHTGSNYLETGTTWILSDRQLGAEPTSFSANNIVLSNGAALKFVDTSAPWALDTHRGITLTAGGGSIFFGLNNGYGALSNTITGTGPVTFGFTSGNTAKVTIAGASTYDGVTTFSGNNQNPLFYFTSIGNIGSTTPTSLGTPTTAANGVINVLNGATALTYIGTGASTTDRQFQFNAPAFTLAFGASGAGALTLNGNFLSSGTTNTNLTLTGYGVGILNGNFLQTETTATTLNKTGVGTWQLNGENTYAGTTTVTQGVLEFNTIDNMGAGPSSLGAPTAATGTISLAGGTLRFVGNSAQSTDRLLNVTAASGLETTSSAPITFDGGVVIVTLGKNLTLGGTGVGFLSGTGTISGAGGLAMQGLTGLGTWTLNQSVANSFNGGLSANGGTLVLDYSNLATPTNLVASQALTLGGGSFSVLGKSTGTSSQTLTSLSLTANTGSVLQLNGNGGSGTSLIFSTPAITVGANSTLDIQRTGNTTLTGTLATTNGILANVTYNSTNFATDSGSVFSAFSTYTGSLTASGAGSAITDNRLLTGSLNMTGTNLFYTLKIAPTVTGSLDMAGFGINTTSGSLTSILFDGTQGAAYSIINSGTLSSKIGNSAQTLYLTTTGTSALTIQAGLMNGASAGTVVKAGNGTLILSGTNNTYIGQTNVEYGNLQAGANGALSLSSTFNLGVSGVVSTGGFSVGMLALGGNGIVQNGATGSGTLTIGANNTNSGAGFNGTNATFSGIIEDYISSVSGTGSLSLVKAGYGTETFNNAYNALNTYSGSTSILSGILSVDVLADSGVASSIGTGSTINIGSTGQLATLQVNLALTANNETNRSIVLASGGTSAIDVVGGGGIIAIPSQGANNPNGDLYGALVTVNGNISGGGTLLKLGSGNLDLRGTNTYTGGTVVDQGILRYGTTSALSTTGSITVNSGGTVGPGYALTQTFLNKITSNSTGVVALGADSTGTLTSGTTGTLDFTNLPNVALGAMGHNVYSGSITPGANGYQLGGGGFDFVFGSNGGGGATSALFIANANVITGNNNVTISPHGTQGAVVVFDDTQNFNGSLTVGGNINAAAVSSAYNPNLNSGFANSGSPYTAFAQLVLAGGSAGSLTGVTSINLNPFGSLSMIATPQSVNRLPDNTPINFSGGTLAFLNDSATDGSLASYAETTGTVNLLRGNSTILTQTASGTQTSVLTLSNLVRSTGATVTFAGVGLGSSAANQIVISSLNGAALSNTTLATPWATYSTGKIVFGDDSASDFATITGTTTINGTTVFGSVVATNGGTITTAAQLVGGDYSITNNGTVTNLTITATASMSANTLRMFNAGNGAVVTLGIGAANTFSVNGIMNGNSGTNSNTTFVIGNGVGDGSLTSLTGTELIIAATSVGAFSSSETITINSNIVNNGNGPLIVTKTGIADATLSGSNTFTGGIIIDGIGRLVTTQLASLSTGAITLNSGELNITGLAANAVVTNAFVTNNDAVILDSSNVGNVQLTGNITLNNGTLYYISSSSQTRALTGTISGSGNLTLQGGGGITTISGTGNNTNTGLTSITGRPDGGAQTIINLEKSNLGGGNPNAIGGNILLGASSVVSPQAASGPQQEILVLDNSGTTTVSNDQIADTSVITFQGGNGYDAGVFRLNNRSETIGGIQSATTGDGLIQNNSNTGGTSTLTINTTGTNSYTFSGLIQNHDNSNSNVGLLGLTKAGTGTLTLSNNDTYTGATSINAGTLNVTGTLASAVTISGTATLAGTGKVGDVTLGSGSNINTTDGLIGKLTVGNLTVNGGSLTFDIGPGGSNNLDSIVALGNLTATGTNTINIANVSGSPTLTSGTYTLISYTGSLTGSLSNFVLGSTSLDGATLSLTSTAGLIQLVITGPLPPTQGVYTLVASTGGVTALHAGGTTTVTSTMTNVGTGTQDSLGFTNLGVSTSTGTLVDTPTASGTLVQTASGTNAGSFTAGSTGTTATFTATVGSVTGTSTGTGSLVSSTTGSIVVYTGQSTWNSASNGAWGTISGTQTTWTAAGGTPGLDTNFQTTDSATFGTVGASQGVTVSLNGDNPSLNNITFNTTGGGYTIQQGSTGTITLNNGASAATITDIGSGGASHTISTPIALASNLNATVATTDTITLSGTVSGSGKSVTKNGQGTLIMRGQNTYSAGTAVVSGTVVAGSSTTVSGSTIISGPFGTGTLALSNGTTLNDNGTAITLANALTLNGTITLGGAGSLTFDGTGLSTPSTVSLLGDTTLVVNDTTTINDSINAGSFGLTTAGTGNLNLFGGTTGTGSTTIASGTVTISSGNGLSTGGINLAGGTLTFNGTSNGTLTQNITVTTGVGTIFHTGPALLTLSGTINKNGTTFRVSGGRNRITGPIVGSSPGSDVVYDSASTTELDSASSYNGPTSISGSSTLMTGVNNALPSPAPFTPLTLGAVSDTGSMTNTLDLMGNSETVASITTAGSGVNQVISSNATFGNVQIGSGASGTTGNLTVNVSGTTTNTYSGLLGDSNGPRSANNFSLTKSGTGTLALTNANSYTGGTTVQTGTLIVSNTTGSATGSGSFTLNSGATLLGNGKINGTTNTISGNVMAGTSLLDTTSILTVASTGTTTFATSNLTFNLSTTTLGQSNSISLLGTPTIDFSSGITATTLTFNLVGGGAPITDGTDYILFAATSGSQFADLNTVGGKITNFNIVFNGTTAGQANSIYYGNSYIFLSGGNLEIQIVPEPGTWALMLGGLALLLVYQRARRSKDS